MENEVYVITDGEKYMIRNPYGQKSFREPKKVQEIILYYSEAIAKVNGRYWLENLPNVEIVKMTLKLSKDAK